jgi:flagellar hook-associated protein 3 FlgL
MTVSMNGLAMPSIELTPSVMNGEMISNLNGQETSIAQLQEQLSTGNVVNQPSDNPALAANIMQINSALSRATSYSNNASDGLGWLQTGNSTMNEIVSTLQSVRQDVLSASSASLAGSQSGLQALADQVNQAQQTLLNLANTTYNGQAIFAGTGNVTTAFDSSGNYVGGGSAPTRTVAPGTSVSVSVTGDSIFGSGTSGLLSTTPGSLGVLAQLAQDIGTGTTASLASASGPDLQNLDAAISTVENGAAQLGAQYQQMQALQTQATNTSAALNTELSGIQSVNLPQAMTNLTQEQNSYQTALWATGQLVQPSLVSFLS